MKHILYLCCLLGLAACNNKKPETAQAYPTTPTGLQGIQQSAVKSNVQTGNTGALNPAHGQPGHRCDLPVGAPLNSQPAQAAASIQQQVVTPQPPIQNASTSGQLNPKHGEPNHRCDIAVGAPLNSNPTQSTATPQRLNPAHGKPGHKCEIAVGAPLT